MKWQIWCLHRLSSLQDTLLDFWTNSIFWPMAIKTLSCPLNWIKIVQNSKKHRFVLKHLLVCFTLVLRKTYWCTWVVKNDQKGTQNQYLYNCNIWNFIKVGLFWHIMSLKQLKMTFRHVDNSLPVPKPRSSTWM